MASQNSTKPLLAALLPMGTLFDRVYTEAIVPCSTELGMEAQRVQAEFSDRHALSKVHDQIRQAQQIIADITARNPNVLYQIGYAHAADKRVILIAQHGEDLPFPRSNYPTLIYAGNISELRRQLRETVQPTPPGVAFLAPSNGHATAPEENASDKFLSLFGDLLTEYGCQHRGGIHMENEKTFVLENQELELALVQALARRPGSWAFALSCFDFCSAMKVCVNRSHRFIETGEAR